MVPTTKATTTGRRVSMLEKFYAKYEYLAINYAKQVFNYERYGYEKVDVEQEFKIKVYTSIITYAEKLAEYKQTGRYKPVPIEYYLKSAMVNKVKDFVRKFNLAEVANAPKISIQDNAFDYGIQTTMESDLGYLHVNSPAQGGATTLLEQLAQYGSPEERQALLYVRGAQPVPAPVHDVNRFIINGVDLLEGIDCIRRRALFILYLRGYTIRELKRKFRRAVHNVEEAIHRQQRYLRQKYSEALLEYQTQTFHQFAFETE